MWNFLTGSLAVFTLLLGDRAYADCEDARDGTLRGEYRVQLPAGPGVLLSIEQRAEDLTVLVREPANSFRVNHPGGAGIAEFVLLESSGESAAVEVCLYSRFRYSEPGTHVIEQIPISDFSPGELDSLRDMTRAAMLWAEDRVESRAAAAELYNDIATRPVSVTGSLQAQALLFEIIARMRRSEYALALVRMADLEALAIPDTVIRYKAAWRKGEIYLRQSQREQASAELVRALSILENDPVLNRDAHMRDQTEIRILLGESYLAVGRLEVGLAEIERALLTAETEYRLLAKVHSSLGYIDFMSSEQPGLVLAERRRFLGRSINNLLSGRYFAESASDTVVLASIENDLGFVYDRLGEHRRSLLHFRQILNLADSEEDPQVYRVASANLGRIYQYLADYPRSESYYRQAVAMDETANARISLSRCQLGTTLRLNGNPEAAVDEHLLCLQQAEIGGNSSVIVQAMYELGEDYLALGDEQAGWKNVQQAWEQRLAVNAITVQARILRRYALLLEGRGLSEEATSIIGEAIALHENNSDRLSPADLIENHATAMQIAILQGEMDKAEEEGLRSIQMIEALYEQLESERLGPAWSSRTHEIFVQVAQMYLHAYFESGDEAALRQAFEITERSRAITLRQQFASRSNDSSDNDTESSSDSVQRAAEQAQIRRISEIANTHAVPGSSSVREIRLPTDYYHHQDILSLYRLGEVERLPLPPAMSLAQIQATLKPGQAMLYYLMSSAAESHVFTLTTNSLRVDRLPETSAIDVLVDTANAALADPNASPYATLAELSARLLQPLGNLDDINELLIVPHGSLHALSFAALPQLGANDGTYRPLVSRLALQSIPSATAYLMGKAHNRSAEETDIAIFADPVFDAEQTRRTLALRSEADVDSLRGWSDNLERLAHTAIEAENLAELFSAERTILLTGNRASRANLAREDIRNAKVLHIATHGYFNAASDDNVGLGFSVIDENGVPDSGFVTLPELFSYRFHNELVVISGCDTAMGRPLAGEGMMGLSRGFIAQGARHVISTLWPVSDRASADFMAIFYRHLLALGNVSHALQAAQNELQQNPGYRNPFYWAAYTLTSVSPDQNMAFANSANTSTSP